MGVKNFMKIIKNNSAHGVSNITVDELHNKSIAVDANLFIYKSVFAIRGGMGKDIIHKINGKNTKVTHLYIMFNRLYNMIYINHINPVFVFDYSFPDIKGKCLTDRNNKRKEYKRLYLTTKDEDSKKKYFHICENISRIEYSDTMTLLDLFGIPYIIAHEEADSQCAYMINEGLVDYVISDDMDLLLFGCARLIKKFTTVEGKNMELIELPKILKDMGFNMRAFIQLGILMGSDYADTIKGMGMIGAYNTINKYRSIATARMVGAIPKDYKYELAYKYFVDAKHKKIDKSELKLKPVNTKGLKKYMIDKGFNESNTVMNRLNKLK